MYFGRKYEIVDLADCQFDYGKKVAEIPVGHHIWPEF